MSKPKGKTPSLISGKKPKKVKVKKRINCVRCKCAIEAGADCFGIPNIRVRFLSPIKKYCKQCFDNIIDQTQRDLDEARNL